MGGLVSTNKATFIPGRQITDGILLAHELVQGFNRKSGSFCACVKVDLQKAYDSVNCEFLWKVLEDLGFGTRWIGWMKQCIADPTFSVLVNGSPTRFISSTRVLRQGDPLPPYLFALVMEVFSTQLDLEVLRGNISLPLVNRGISNLIFTDDVLVFSSSHLHSLKCIDLVFSRFTELSGLAINKVRVLCSSVKATLRKLKSSKWWAFERERSR